jgi:glycosyltransferase involved in cell wall biosynthesis
LEIRMRVLFVHGAPWPHSLHVALARSVGAEFVAADRHLPLSPRSSRARRYLSWAVNAALLPRDHDLFLTEGTQVPPILLRKCGLLKRRQRVAALMADHTLYFLRSGAYAESTRRLILRLLTSFDALVCIGEMQTQIASELLAGAAVAPRILTCRTALEGGRRDLMAAVRPDTESRHIAFIGNGPDGWRARYKGIDLLLETAAILQARGHDFRLRVVGLWDATFVETLLRSHPGLAERITFHGEVKDPAPYLSGAGLYVHLGRGDAWPVSVLEAMAGGLPALVSEWTGSKEAASRLDPRLVVPLDAATAADRIAWYWALSAAERVSLSGRAREIAGEYTEAAAFARFAEAIRGAADAPAR